MLEGKRAVLERAALALEQRAALATSCGSSKPDSDCVPDSNEDLNDSDPDEIPELVCS